MRSLIRPSLFLVARLGLLLALLSWVISQGWHISAGPIQVVDRGLVTVLPWSARQITNFGLGLRRDNRFLKVAFGEQLPPQNPSAKTSPFKTIAAFPGLLAMSETRPGSSAGMISVRHWLNVTLMAAFYGVVAAWYRLRKSPQGQEQEVRT